MKKIDIFNLPIKCSYMNDTKWVQVLEVIVAENIEPRIKTVYLDVADPMQPYGAICYNANDPDCPIRPFRIWRVTPAYWDTTSGPFRTREIEWLVLSTSDFDRIADRLPPNLMLVHDGAQVVIKGYEC